MGRTGGGEGDNLACRLPDASGRNTIRLEEINSAGRKMHQRLNIDKATLARFCEHHHIRRLALFGSRLKGTAGPDSDVDLLVEFDRNAIPTLFDMAEMEQELSDLLGGPSVDLRTEQDLSRYFRDEVVRTAEVQYAR